MEMKSNSIRIIGALYAFAAAIAYVKDDGWGAIICLSVAVCMLSLHYSIRKNLLKETVEPEHSI